MNYIIEFDIAAIIILIAIIVSFTIKKTVQTRLIRTFSIFIWDVLFCSVFDILAIISYEYTSIVPLWLLYFFNIMYFLTFSFLPFIFTKCVIYLTNNDSKISLKRKIFNFLPYFIGATLVISTPFTKLVFYFDDSLTYQHGPCFIFMFIFAIIYILEFFYLAIKHRKSILEIQIFSIIIYLLVPVISQIIQIIWPRLMIMDFCISLSALLLYISFENSSEYLDLEHGIFNRKAFITITKQNLESKKKVKFLSIMIENLAYLNKTIEAEARYELIQGIIKYLENVVGKKKVYRISDIIFVLELSNDDREKSVQVERIHKRFFESFSCGEDISFSLNVLMNLVYCPEDANNIGDTIDLIENSFSEIVAGVEKKVLRANKSILVKRRREQKILEILEKAIETESFEVIYQPIYSLKEERYSVAEALLRLKSEEMGFISPEEFIPLAEQNGMILRIGNLVFKQVCKFLSESRLWEWGIEYIFVNLSVIQCMQEKLAEQLIEIMDSFDLPYKYINLEVKETTVIATGKNLLKNMEKLVEKNVGFSLDDYGIDVSNTANIIKYPFNVIKIDKTMVWASMQNEDSKKILSQTIKMIKELDLVVIAEGVETREQSDELINMDVDFIQGNFYTFPLRKQDFIMFIKSM